MSHLAEQVQPLLSIRNLRVERGGRHILRGINADLARGKITALIGLNGSGKTTLLRALVGEYPCTGEVKFFCGHDHTKYEPDHIGYVPQKLTVEPRLPLTVRELFGLALQRRALFFNFSSRVSKRIDELLIRVRATHLRERPVNALSGGELQRVLLALALEPQPELLLLDEPTAGIDFRDQDSFYDLLSQLNKETKMTILLVSHELSVVSKHAHHVLCLSDGIIECEGKPEEMLKSDILSRTFGAEKRLYTHHHDCDHDHSDHDHDHGACFGH